MDRLRQAAPGPFFGCDYQWARRDVSATHALSPGRSLAHRGVYSRAATQRKRRSADVPAAQRGQFAKVQYSAHSSRSGSTIERRIFIARFEGLRRKALIAAAWELFVSALGFSRRILTIFFRSYLFAFVFWLAFPLGALGDADAAPASLAAVGDF